MFEYLIIPFFLFSLSVYSQQENNCRINGTLPVDFEADLFLIIEKDPEGLNKLYAEGNPLIKQLEAARFGMALFGIFRNIVEHLRCEVIQTAPRKPVLNELAFGFFMICFFII